jgi:hypothetical protein
MDTLLGGRFVLWPLLHHLCATLPSPCFEAYSLMNRVWCLHNTIWTEFAGSGASIRMGIIQPSEERRQLPAVVTVCREQNHLSSCSFWGVSHKGWFPPLLEAEARHEQAL